jgi:uncharacterized membrane protein YcaP (DUF421 family)
MFQQLGTSWSDVALVVVSTVSIYAAFVILVRVMGQRSLATVAAFDLALVVAVGSLIARTSLLRAPTLAQGLIALVTLFALQAAVARLRRFSAVDHVVSRQPVLLVLDGEVLHHNLRRAHLLEAELRQKLRLAGVGSLAVVKCAALERNGAISVIQRGMAMQSDVMIDVAGTHVADSRRSLLTDDGRERR